MSTRIDSGRTGSISQIDIQETAHIEKFEPKSAEDNTSISDSGRQAMVSNATARAAENSITSKILASQLQDQITAAGPDSAPKVPSQGKLLIRGSVDPSVKDFQKQLNEFRADNGLPPIKEDGIFGPETEKAVLQFQRATGLKDDAKVGDNTRSRMALENSPSFKSLNPDTKDQIRGMMNNFQNDPTNRQLLLTIGLDESFAKLSRPEQEAALQNLSGSASALTQQTLKGMNNDELLKLAETPGGQERLAGMKFALQQGPITPETIKELNRLDAATFTPGDGLKVRGTKADQDAYLHIVRRDMLKSPSFAKTMKEINADKAHPVTVNVGRDMPRVRLDRDDLNGLQQVDLNDFDKLPENPPADKPNAITQGSVMAHAMREARQTALGAKKHATAHAEAIKEENAYRKDIGQTVFRKPFPDDETVEDNGLEDKTLVIHFDNGDDERLVFDKKQRLIR